MKITNEIGVISISRMVEVQSININDLVKNEDGSYKNEIKLSPYKQLVSKCLASESELHRILLHLNKSDSVAGSLKPNGNSDKYTPIPSYFTLDVGKNKSRYDKLIESNGELIITNMEYELDENGNKILDEEDHYKLCAGESKKYVSTFCGAGHSRTQKNLFVEESVIKRLNDIILCGMPENLIYDRPSKWNAYYAMVTTDSTPVSYMPNIVVIDDYEKTVVDEVDIVEVSGHGKDKKYSSIRSNNGNVMQEVIPILPFDGAGLVTPQCALKWARELGCKSSAGNFYMPSCFQFRAIPGIKGELMVFDLRGFACEHKVSKIVDLGGKEWDIFVDEIDVVLTKSQFKFWKQYLDKDGKFDYWSWRKMFEKKCHGYQRTFNIVSYGKHPNDLRKMTMLSYQPLQTVNFTQEEIPLVMKSGLDIYRKVTSDVNEFLKYRRIVTVDSETGEVSDNTDEYTPPYYIALAHNKKLFYDEYVHKKIMTDVEKLKNNILSGKIWVKGNYQVFMPDLYGLAEWAFHDELGYEPKGLLDNPYDMYSDWWNFQGKTEIDIMRNPAIGMEHRIAHLRNNKKIKKWYKYQSTGIITGMYDILALALNSADYDGDTVCTTDNSILITAVKRELDAGNGRLVIKKVIDESNDERKTTGIDISDRAALMKINQMSYKNSIGSVIDRITDLWSMVKEEEFDESIVRDYINIGVVVGSETIDFAKTGENAAFPDDVKRFLAGKKKGYWMRYLSKHVSDGLKEQKALKREERRQELLGIKEIDLESIRKFSDYNCNMNRLCHYAETEIEVIDRDINYKSNSLNKFNHRKYLIKEADTAVSEPVDKAIRHLQKEYQSLSSIYRKEVLKSKESQRFVANKYRWFYEYCRNELLFAEPDINKLLDMLVIIYYGDKYNGSGFVGLEKDILWNAFPKEMIQRCAQKDITTVVNYEKLKKNHDKNVEYKKRQKEKRQKRKHVCINSIDNNDSYLKRCVVLTKEDRKSIDQYIKSAYDQKLILRKDNCIKLKRILAMIIFLSRKMENTDPKKLIWLEKLDNVPDELTDSTLEKLTGVNHKYMDTALVLFEKLGLIQRNNNPTYGKVRFKVTFNSPSDGKVWIETSDYNKAGAMIRDCYRESKIRKKQIKNSA